LAWLRAGDLRIKYFGLQAVLSEAVDAENSCKEEDLETGIDDDASIKLLMILMWPVLLCFSNHEEGR